MHLPADAPSDIVLRDRRFSSTTVVWLPCLHVDLVGRSTATSPDTRAGPSTFAARRSTQIPLCSMPLMAGPAWPLRKGFDASAAALGLGVDVDERGCGSGCLGDGLDGGRHGVSGCPRPTIRWIEFFVHPGQSHASGRPSRPQVLIPKPCNPMAGHKAFRLSAVHAGGESTFMRPLDVGFDLYESHDTA